MRRWLHRTSCLVVCLLLFSCGSGDLVSVGDQEPEVATQSPSGETRSADQLQLGLVEAMSLPQGDQPTDLIAVTKTLWLISSRQGRIYRVEADGLEADPEVVLDLGDVVESGFVERGLFSMQYSPSLELLFIYYTDKEGKAVIATLRLKVEGSSIAVLGPKPGVLLSIEEPYVNHNGGALQLDAAGNLLIGVGDGGLAGDPGNKAQDPTSLLGKILRITPTGSGYLIPKDNPYASGAEAAGAPEIYSLGLRNPYRMFLDKDSNELYVADVGQDKYEEIDQIRLSAARGANFGWPYYEGDEIYDSQRSIAAPLVEPTYVYAHENGACAITGGLVIDGGALLDVLSGYYVFSDYCDGVLRFLDPGQKTLYQPSAAQDLVVEHPYGFFESGDGRLFVLSGGGSIFELVAT